MTRTDHCDPDCWACGRQTDPLDGVQTDGDFECGPCFVSRESTSHGVVTRERNEP